METGEAEQGPHATMVTNKIEINHYHCHVSCELCRTMELYSVNNCQHVSTTKLLGASRRNFDMCLLVNLGPDACLNYTPMPRVYETKQTADPAWQALLQLLAAQLVGSFNLLEP